MPVNVDATLQGIENLEKRVKVALYNFVEEAAKDVQQKAAAFSPEGTGGNSTNAPGDLARSIYITGPVNVNANGTEYYAEIGPTVIYGRLRELGGEINAVMAFHWGKFPYGRWGTIARLPDGRVLVQHITQKPEPYLHPAYVQLLPKIESMVRTNLLTALGVSPNG